jgi:hypothetical protein
MISENRIAYSRTNMGHDPMGIRAVVKMNATLKTTLTRASV